MWNWIEDVIEKEKNASSLGFTEDESRPSTLRRQRSNKRDGEAIRLMSLELGLNQYGRLKYLLNMA